MDDEVRRILESKDYNIIIGDKYTFAYVVKEKWDEYLAKKWNSLETQKRYMKEYVTYFFPYLNKKPLENYKKEDFDSVMFKIKRQRREERVSTSPQIIRHLEYIMRQVTKAAAEYEICEDVLWGSRYEIPDSEQEDEKLKDSLVRLQKSLTIKEEMKIAQLLLTDETQSGEFFGLALMFCLGLRENEACAATFEDVRPFQCDSEKYCLWIYKTSERNTRNTKYSGKTENSPRIIPMPDKLTELILKRKEYFQKTINADQRKHMERWPIACTKAYNMQCKPSELSMVGTKLLREAKVSEMMMSFVDDSLQDEQRRREPGVIEKDPTAYLFRRNMATHLYILGLDDHEIQYIIGHDIEDENDARNYFRNEEKLYQIAKKIWKRPLVNNTYSEEKTVSQFASFSDVTNIHLKMIIEREGQFRLTVKQREPHSETTIQFDEKCDGQYYCIPNMDEFHPTINITEIYRQRYQKAEEHAK